MDRSARHLRLLTETIAAVNSTLDLDEVFEQIARKVAEALETDACFVYLYDEAADELVLRASFGTRVEDMTRVPKMRPGEGITGTAAAERAPVMIAREAHLDPRFKRFPNLREEHYQSILAVPILARERLEGALNVRTETPREFSREEIDLLMAIAGQVAQAIENAKLYDHAQRRVAELEALAAISEAVSESLYLEESMEAIVKTTVDAVGATGAALVLQDGTIAWPEGRAGEHAVRLPPALEGPTGRRARLRPRHAVHARGAPPARLHRASRRRRARARAGRPPRRPRSGDPPPGEEQPPDRGLAPQAPGGQH